MTALVHLVSFRRVPRRRAAVLARGGGPPGTPRRLKAWTGVLAAGASLMAAGCSASSNSAAGSSALRAAPAGAGAAHAPAAAPVPGQIPKTAGLTSVPLPGGQSVIFTASLSLHASDVQATVARATRLAEAAGGYVSGEHKIISHGRHPSSTVSIQFKVPAAGYPATVSALAGLGKLGSETQQAQDVTGTVADVNSRVASAQAAIIQLRKLLARAGTVGGLLTVQDQINSQEASLEALQSQQRALARETAYATISLTVLGNAAPRARHHRHRTGPAGFLGGLAAGWRALRAVVSWILTVAGAMLPFAIPLGLAGLAALAGWRRLGRRRASARPEAPAS